MHVEHNPVTIPTEHAVNDRFLLGEAYSQGAANVTFHLRD
jgi:hypothetical protein